MSDVQVKHLAGRFGSGTDRVDGRAATGTGRTVPDTPVDDRRIFGMSQFADLPPGAVHATRVPPMTDAPLPARRDQIVAQLGAAWAAESIDEAEMERRMALAFAARESVDLERLVADLPVVGALMPIAPGGPIAEPAPRGTQLAALRRVILGSVDERVRGTVPARVEFGVRLGNFELDFTEAIFTSDVTEIVVDVVLGNLEIRLPGDVMVESRVDGVLSSVEFHDQRVTVPTSGQTVRLTGSCWLGNVEVTAVGKARGIV